MKANAMTIYKLLVLLLLLLTPALPVSGAETETDAKEKSPDKFVWHVKLKRDLGDNEFFGWFEDEDDRTTKYILDEPGYDKPGREKRRIVRKSEVASIDREGRSKRVARWKNDYNMVPVTMSDGSESWMNQNEVTLAKRAFEMAAKVEEDQALPTMPARGSAAEDAVETAAEEGTQEPGLMGLWGARIILVVVAAAIVAVLLKTMVLASPE